MWSYVLNLQPSTCDFDSRPLAGGRHHAADEVTASEGFRVVWVQGLGFTTPVDP